MIKHKEIYYRHDGTPYYGTKVVLTVLDLTGEVVHQDTFIVRSCNGKLEITEEANDDLFRIFAVRVQHVVPSLTTSGFAFYRKLPGSYGHRDFFIRTSEVRPNTPLYVIPGSENVHHCLLT